jgi:hypothetical protein
LAFENAAHWYDVALRAMDFVASNPDATAHRRELHVKRGGSFFAVGEWAPAKNAFEAAVSLLSPAEHEKRAELLVRLAEAAFWLMDVAALAMISGRTRKRGWPAEWSQMATCWQQSGWTARRLHAPAAFVPSALHAHH